LKLKQVLNNTFFNVIVSVSKAFFDLIFVKYCVENFGDNQYSDWVYIISIVSFFKLIDLGTNQTIIRTFIKEKFKEISFLFSFKIIVFIFFSIISYTLIDYYFDFFSIEYIENGKLILLTLVICQIFHATFCGPLSSLLISKEKFIPSIIINGLYVLLPLFLFLSFSLSDLLSLAYLNIFSLVICFILLFYYSNYRLIASKINIKFNRIQLDFKSNSSFFLFNLLTIFYPFVELFFLKFYLSNEILVNHIIYFRFPLLFVAFMAQLMTNYFPSVSKLSTKSLANGKLYLNSLTLSLITFIYFCSILIFCFNNPLIYLWMGDGYFPSLTVMLMIQILTFSDGLIWSIHQILLPYNPDKFKFKFFIYELIIRFSIFIVLYNLNLISYDLVILTTIITKTSLLFIILKYNDLLNFNFFNNKFYSVIIFSSFIYLISFFFYSDKFLITLIYSVLFMVLMIYLIYNYKNQIKDLV
jgi:O-antigen/teichoic acid export membrane protein